MKSRMAYEIVVGDAFPDDGSVLSKEWASDGKEVVFLLSNGGKIRLPPMEFVSVFSSEEVVKEGAFLRDRPRVFRRPPGPEEALLPTGETAAFRKLQVVNESGAPLRIQYSGGLLKILRGEEW